MSKNLKMKKIILQLNEINFDLYKQYEKCFPDNFCGKIENYNFTETTSETEYQNLEPWIQWVTFYTGLPYKEHKIFRLGDSHRLAGQSSTILDDAHHLNLKTGVLCSMNCPNGDLAHEYFISDAWSQEKEI